MLAFSKLCTLITLFFYVSIGITSAQVDVDTVSTYITNLEVKNERLTGQIQKQEKMIQDLLLSNESLYLSLSGKAKNDENSTLDSVLMKELESKNQSLKERITEQDILIQELTDSNEKLYASLADQLNIEKSKDVGGDQALEASADVSLLNQQIADQEKLISELTENKANLEKKNTDQEQIIDLLTVDNTNLREEITLQLSQKEEMSSPTQQVEPRVEEPQRPDIMTKSAEESPRQYSIQFFKSKYSNKTFPSLSGIGSITSIQKDNLTSYQLIVDDPSKLSLVRAAGFGDAYLIK